MVIKVVSLFSLENVADLNPAEKPPIDTTSRRDGDGCYHVFLDVGANIGVHGRFLFEPENYNESWFATELFKSEFGEERDNRDFCSFEIEANPKHYPKLMANSNAYKSMGWRYEVMIAGASDRDGFMDFMHNQDEGYEEWGFSVKGYSEQSIAERIRTIHLAAWINENINKRRIPSVPHGDYGSRGPKVVMKMDIEGSEYIVLPDLVLSGALCGIDLVFGEFHGHNDADYIPLNFTGHRISIDTTDQAEVARMILKGVIPMSRNCKTRLVELDDESYLHDGVALPKAKRGRKQHLRAKATGEQQV